MTRSKNYKFITDVWLYPGETANWHMAYVPPEISAMIDKKYLARRRGWSSYPVEVAIGQTKWRTSIFYDKKASTYLLPIKASVRKKEKIYADDKITPTIKILV